MEFNSKEDIADKLSSVLGISNDNGTFIFDLIQDIILQNIVDQYRINKKAVDEYTIPFFNLGTIKLKLRIKPDKRYQYDIKVVGIINTFEESDYLSRTLYEMFNKNYDPIYSKAYELLDNKQFDEYVDKVRTALTNYKGDKY